MLDQDASASPPSQPDGQNGRHTVLVVDDEPKVLTAIEDSLGSEFKVLIETSASAAIKVLKKEPNLSVIVSDQRMPRMTGDEFLARAMEISDATRVLITGYADLEAVTRAVNLGKIFNYVSKPWDPDNLKSIVHKAAEHHTLRRELAEEQRLLHSLMENIPDAIFFKDLQHRYARLNKAYAEFLGATRPELAVGKITADFLPGSLAENAHADEKEIITTGRPVMDRTERLSGKDGLERWFSRTVAPVIDKEGRVTSLVGIRRDITERKTQEQKIVRLSRIHAVLSGINTAIVRVRTREELFGEACRVAVELGNFRLAWIGIVDRGTMSLRPVASGGCDEGFITALFHLVTQENSLNTGLLAPLLTDRKPLVFNDLTADPQLKLRKEAAERGYRSAAVFPLIVEEVVGVIALCSSEKSFFDDEEEMKLLSEMAGDISFALDHIGKAEQINYLAYYDGLTGLPNRSLFHDRLSQQIQACKQNQQVALLFVDLERFGQINDTLGRHIGDGLLKQVGQRLKGLLKDQDSLARISSDCFAIVLGDVQGAGDVARFMEQQVKVQFSEPLQVNGHELRISVRAGISFYPTDGRDAEALYTNAEIALKKAKKSAERYLFYAPEMNAKVARALTLENKLRKAVEREQFVLYYEPKVDSGSRAIVGLEALMRWNDPEAGLVPPLQFIPVLEETGLIVDVGRWVMGKAVSDYSRWRQKGLRPPRIAVNVSAVQLRQKDFVAMVEGVVHKTARKDHGLDLEITESLIMENMQANVEKLAAIRNMGLHIAVDDFGTGYSSLSYIARLPLDALKIDLSFVANMTRSAEDMAIVSAIISLAHSLELKVIAEGVETEEQARLLKLLKCDEMQGYLFSRALPREQMEAMLKAKNGKR